MPKNIPNKLNIGFVIDDGLGNSNGGVQQYVLGLGQWFRDRGHNVSYLAGQTSRADLDGLYSMSKNLRVKFNGNSLSTPLPAPRARIKAVLDKCQLDILHVQVPYSPFMAGRVIKLASTKTAVVGTFHIMPISPFHSFCTRLLGLWLRRNLTRFDQMLSVSGPAQAFAKKAFGVDSLVIPNTVDINKFKKPEPKISGSKKRLFFLGRLVPRKGCLQLLEAINSLNDDLKSQIQLDICSDGPLRIRLEKYCAQNNLDKIVKFHGFVSDQTKIDLLSKADIALFPSYGGESFGIVLLEAMAVGKPVVIAGDNVGYRSVLGSVPQSIVDSHNTKQFSRLLKRLITDPKFTSAIFAHQQSLIAKYDIDQVATEILNVYNDLHKYKN